MEHLVILMQQYGYFLVFFGTLLEGETIVALAGFTAYQGHLHIATIIPIAIVGAAIGDNFFFYLGRHKGRKILKRYPNWHMRAEKIHGWMERNQNLLIFGSRFLYGFRAITPVILGTSKVSSVRFFTLNLLGAVLWAFIFTFGGYVFSGAIEHFLGSMKKFEGMIVAVGISIAVLVQIYRWWAGRRR